MPPWRYDVADSQAGGAVVVAHLRRACVPSWEGQGDDAERGHPTVTVWSRRRRDSDGAQPRAGAPSPRWAPTGLRATSRAGPVVESPHGYGRGDAVAGTSRPSWPIGRSGVPASTRRHGRPDLLGDHEVAGRKEVPKPAVRARPRDVASTPCATASERAALALATCASNGRRRSLSRAALRGPRRITTRESFTRRRGPRLTPASPALIVRKQQRRGVPVTCDT